MVKAKIEFAGKDYWNYFRKIQMKNPRDRTTFRALLSILILRYCEKFMDAITDFDDCSRVLRYVWCIKFMIFGAS